MSSRTAVATRTMPLLAPFTPTWLRDSCACATCRDPHTGQKLLDLADVPVDTAIREATQTADTVTITFGPDGHRSTFTHAWLATQLEHATTGDGRTERDKTLWGAADLPDVLPRTPWPSFRDDSVVRAHALRRVRQVGFVILSGTPDADRAVAEIATTFGFVRETHYGRVFDVQVQPDARHLADTSRCLPPHTDNPYRDPVPTVQLLHCLTGAVDGGESGLLDGFHAAALLRRHDPDAFDILTSTLVTFTRSDAHAALRADRPIVDVDPDGHIREVRFNHRAMTVPLTTPTHTRAFHAAYRRFATIIARPTLQVWFRLEPGDCLILDNTRILHARAAFTDAGGRTRHLQGCYADLDALASTLAVLDADR